jgi:hypothetical protein
LIKGKIKRRDKSFAYRDENIKKIKNIKIEVIKSHTKLA